MNEKQFEALLSVFEDIANEISILRDEFSDFRDVFGRANGFESDIERSERIEKALKDGTIFDDDTDGSNVGQA